MITPTPILDRLMAKVRPDASGCWIFHGSRSAHGYGRIYDRARGIPVQAHRVTFGHLVGPIPDDLQLDHLCRVPPCVNPAHLEPVTARENTVRGLAVFNGEHNRIKAVCPAGHSYDPTNTRFTPQGWRYCLACKRRQSATNYARKARAA